MGTVYPWSRSMLDYEISGHVLLLSLELYGSPHWRMGTCVFPKLSRGCNAYNHSLWVPSLLCGSAHAYTHPGDRSCTQTPNPNLDFTCMSQYFEMWSNQHRNPGISDSKDSSSLIQCVSVNLKFCYWAQVIWCHLTMSRDLLHPWKASCVNRNAWWEDPSGSARPFICLPPMADDHSHCPQGLSCFALATWLCILDAIVHQEPLVTISHRGLSVSVVSQLLILRFCCIISCCLVLMSSLFEDLVYSVQILSWA